MSTKITVLDEVRHTLTKMEPQFKAALPPHVPAERFVRVAMTAVQKNPDLLNADRQSLYGACMMSAQDGLIPDGREAALVLFSGKVQYMPMVAGILKKVRNSGELATITPQVVHKNDKFRFWVDSEGEHIEHEPLLFGDRGEVLGVYALAKTNSGNIYVEVMTVAQVERVRSVSRAKNAGPWKDWWDEMAKKTAIRRLSKRLPMSTDLDDLLRRDDDMYELNPQAEKEQSSDITDGEAPAKPKRSSRMSKIVESQPEVIEGEFTAHDEPAAPYDLDSDLTALRECETMESLQSVFGAAWKSCPADQRDALKGAYDYMKSKLQTDDEVPV